MYESILATSREGTAAARVYEDNLAVTPTPEPEGLVRLMMEVNWPSNYYTDLKIGRFGVVSSNAGHPECPFFFFFFFPTSRTP